MNDFELQRKLIFSVIVAGKSAKFAGDVMRRLFSLRDAHQSYLEQVGIWIEIGLLDAVLELARTGNYRKLSRCLRELVKDCPDLETCTPEELEKIHGIGPKTSRFFILWTRTDAPYAALDVHVLRWLGRMGYSVPKSTPQAAARYSKIEQWFLSEAKKRNVTPRVLDHAIWVEGAKHHERTEETNRLVQKLPAMAD